MPDSEEGVGVWPAKGNWVICDLLHCHRGTNSKVSKTNLAGPFCKKKIGPRRQVSIGGAIHVFIINLFQPSVIKNRNFNWHVLGSGAAPVNWIGEHSNRNWARNVRIKLCPLPIHSKKWIPWIPESAENFEFSAERLSENAKTINSAMCVEITVKRHLPCHSTLRYIHYLAIVLVAINTLLDLFWHFVFKWSMFLKFY